jgi:hypothetical protein
MVFNILYEKMANCLTNWENHKTQRDYEFSISGKT